MNTQTITKRIGTSLKLAGVAAAMFISSIGSKVQAQESYSGLNLGLGIGYYSYYNNQSVPYFTANYEFDVARQFTLAPFIGYSSYRSSNYYGNHYYFRQTIIPIGVKGTYYFDNLLGAGPNWDFYLAGSLGYNIARTTWDNGYTGDRDNYRDVSPLYLDLHIGTEYHFNNKVGLFLDLSTGVSTIGLAIHPSSSHVVVKHK